LCNARNGLNWLETDCIPTVLLWQIDRSNNSQFRGCFCSDNEPQQRNVTRLETVCVLEENSHDCSDDFVVNVITGVLRMLFV
jgi:hypothetical protein